MSDPQEETTSSRDARDLSPSERLQDWVRNRWRDRGAEGTLSKDHTLLRQLLVTLGLLVLWQAAHFIPLPVLSGSAVTEFAHQFRSGIPLFSHLIFPRVSLLSLGYSPFLQAHFVLFWFVVCIPRLRKMGFSYRWRLDFHVTALSFLLAAGYGMFQLTWFLGIVSPSSATKIVSRYFLDHLLAYRVAGLCALLAGYAFTLLVLRLIRSYGLPFPLTCMVAWDVLFPVVREFLSLEAEPLHVNDPHGTLRATTAAAALVVLGLLGLFAFKIYTSRVTGAGGDGRNGAVPRFWSEEPSFLAFGLLSASVLFALWQLAQRVLLACGQEGVLSLPRLDGELANKALSYGVPATLGLLSTLLFHRLFYNVRLRERLGVAIQSPAPSRVIVWRAFGFWCLFFILVRTGAFLRDAYYPSYPLLRVLATPLSWDVVLLLLAAAGFMLYARNRRLGFVAPVYTHGYYEPLYAVKALLKDRGIASVFSGEPYALLQGLLVGPLGRKDLLVREPERDLALAVLAEAGVLASESGETRDSVEAIS
jgi:hypothetical protein